MSFTRLLLFLAVALTWTSCKYNSAVLLRTPKDYVYDQLPAQDSVMAQYKISPNDIINLRIYSNDGFKLIDLTSMNPENRQNLTPLTSGLNYVVEQDGFVKLPILGRVKVSGYTLREAEVYLEELFAQDYNNPFILLNVNNRKVIVFPGGKGDAQVIPINNNTTLIEALALAGGISENGKAKKIKLIRRQDKDDPKVYLINLATIDGLQYSHLVLQADDLIYVEPKTAITREVVRDVAAYLGILTSALILYRVSQSF